MATETLSEAEKQRRVPGVYFATEPTGRCAKIAGTGLGVWEIIKGLVDEGGDREAVAEGFHWLSSGQLQTAYDYYDQFPEEIDARLALEDLITPEYIEAKYGAGRLTAVDSSDSP